VAERVNGILKGEYGWDQEFKTKAHTTHTKLTSNIEYW
jgi:hypothetical protein